ncbi:response regulator [Flavihumibacter petaseus]|nr:response regulator [Flavihumibacter petaseus]
MGQPCPLLPSPCRRPAKAFLTATCIAVKRIAVSLTIPIILISLTTLTTLLPVPARAQNNPEKGLPFITNYNPKTYKASSQSFSVIEGNDGIMYFGVQSNLLEYDGVRWRKTFTNATGNGLIRCFAKDKNGRIYFGDLGNFGYLDKDSVGQTSLVSLLHLVPDSLRNFFDVWSIYTSDEGIYFQSRERIFRINAKNEVKTWTPSTRFMYSFYVNGKFFVHEQNVGILQLVDDKLQLIPGSEFAGKERMQVMVPYGKDKYLIGLFYSGLYLYDGTTFTPFRSDVNDLVTNSTLYKGLQFANGNYAFSTTGRGLAIVDSTGKIIQMLNRATGMQDESVYAMYPDSKGNIWLALDNGISKVELASPFSTFNIQSGVVTATLGMIRYQGALWVGTTNGLIRFDSSRRFFEPVNDIPQNQTFNLTQSDNRLYVPSDGMFMIENGKVKVVAASNGGDLQITGNVHPQMYPNMMLAGSTFGVAVFARDKPGEVFKYIGRVPKLQDQIWTFAEHAGKNDSTFWAGSQNGNAYMIMPAFDQNGYPDLGRFTYRQFGEAQGLKSALGGVWRVAGDNFFPADSAIYRFDRQTEKFYKDTLFGKWSGKGLEQFEMVEDETGRIWIRFGTETVIATKQADGRYALDSRTLLPIAEQSTLSKIYPDKDGIIWFCTTDGIVRFDSKIQKDFDQSYSTLIRRVTANNQPVELGPAQEKSISLPYKDNALRFEFAAPFYEKEDKTVYQSWLEGFESEWSSWDNTYYKEYTNLPEGTYHFHVRAQNVFRKVSEEAVYSFTILPPWWRTWWAYALYALVGIGILYGLIRYRTRHLRDKHKELEKIVSERTYQLSQRVEELAVINSVQEALVREMKVQNIYELVGDRLREVFSNQEVVIAQIDPQTSRESFAYAAENGKRIYPEPRKLDPERASLFRQNQKVITNGSQGAASLSASSTPPKSAFYIPLTTGENITHYIGLIDHNKENAFTEPDIRLVETLANSLSVALQNARLFAETTQRASELSTVNHISKALVSQLSLDGLIKLVGDHLLELFKADIVYIALLDRKTQIISFPYQVGDNMAPLRLGEGLTSRIINSGEPLLINGDVTRAGDRLGIAPVGIPAASYLGVPIPVGEEVIGVLSVQSTSQANRFTSDDQRLLTTIAASVGMAIRKAKLFDEVQSAKLEAEEARQIAEKANTAKSAFLSTVSHELRTPLTSVLGFAKIIKKRLEEKVFPNIDASDPRTGKTAAQVSENLDVVISEGERLTNLINDVLDLAKIEAGKMEWNMGQVSMGEVMERAIAATSSLFEQKKLPLEKDIPADLPFVTGDHDKLIQVVVNLISNAVKFTGDGKITCSARVNGDHLEMSVHDTGIGIAPEDHDAVFEQFKQVGGDTLTDKPKGTGLGLPICKEIIEHHGGKIWLESEIGKGSTFIFSLPLIQETAGSRKPLQFDSLLQQLREQMAATALHNGTATILVVDDDNSIRSLLQQELSDAGYQVDAATNGKEAIAAIRKQRPDLVILDVMMPEMNGFDVAAILKNDPQTMDIPIIVLSIVQDKARGYRIGVDRYLTKPINTAELFAEVGHLLEQGKSRKKVLVVDEDSAAIKTLSEVLQAKGYVVVESDGQELAEKVVSAQPDIVIINSLLSGNQEIVQSLRFEKGMENVLFLVYQ